jgi:hypothetical protein
VPQDGMEGAASWEGGFARGGRDRKGDAGRSRGDATGEDDTDPVAITDEGLFNLAGGGGGARFEAAIFKSEDDETFLRACCCCCCNCSWSCSSFDCETERLCASNFERSDETGSDLSVSIKSDIEEDRQRPNVAQSYGLTGFTH